MQPNLEASQIIQSLNKQLHGNKQLIKKVTNQLLQNQQQQQHIDAMLRSIAKGVGVLDACFDEPLPPEEEVRTVATAALDETIAQMPKSASKKLMSSPAKTIEYQIEKRERKRAEKNEKVEKKKSVKRVDKKPKLSTAGFTSSINNNHVIDQPTTTQVTIDSLMSNR